MKRGVIGILGGMGPQATNRLFSQIIDYTPADCDQEHVSVIVYNNPKIPDRTKAILSQDDAPAREMLKTALKLQEAGADFIIMPCNTAHYFLPQVEANLKVPVINMIGQTIDFINNNYPDAKKIGLLATSGTIKSGIYNTMFKPHNIDVIMPEHYSQEKVMQGIYSVKAKKESKGRLLLEEAAKNLVEKGADVIVCGCTEIGLALKQEYVNYVLIDPSKVLAQVAVNFAMNPQLMTSKSLVCESKDVVVEGEI